MLTLSTIALESRTDLPKVHYATALDWFIICSFGYCIATLLEFAGVHYFTKVLNFHNFPMLPRRRATLLSKCEEKQLFQVAPSTPCCDVPFVKICRLLRWEVGKSSALLKTL